MTKEELQQRADAYMESLRGQTPFYDWDVKRAYMDGLLEGEMENESPHIDREADAYNRGYNEALKELGWRKYPEKKPRKNGEYLCAINRYGEVDVYKQFYDTRFGWDEDVVAWMPTQKEGGK